MKNYWIKTFRQLAAACVVAGSSALLPAVCYAAAAFDSASDPVYADGWQGQTHAGTVGGGAQLTNGDNGGFGFTQWNFDSAYVASGNYGQPHGFNYGNYADTGIKDINSASPFNNIGTSWRMGGNPPVPQVSGANRAGRGFNLAIGETLKVVFDNPSENPFFKGMFIRLNGGTGGVNGNICNSGGQACTVGGTPTPKMVFSSFEYFSYGGWRVDDGSTPGGFNGDLIPLNITDTAAAGAVLTVARTGAESYILKVDSLDPSSADYPATIRTFSNPGPAPDWIEFTFFGAPADPNKATDLYIRSLSISSGVVPEPGTAALLVLGGSGLLLGMSRRRSEE